MGIAVRRLHFEDAVAEFQDGDIERTAAQVIDGDLFVFLLVHAVGQRSGRRFVDDTLDIEAGDTARVFRRLTLAVVEVSRNRDDGFRDRLAKIRFRVGLQLLKNHSGDFRRGVQLVANLDVRVAVFRFRDFVRDKTDFVFHFRIFTAHQTLDGENRLRRVRDGLTFRQGTDQTFAILRERDDRRSRPRAFGVRNHHGFAVFHDGHAGIGSTKIYA